MLQYPVLARCSTPHGVPGRCVTLRQCPPLIRLLRRPISPSARSHLRASVCRITLRLPEVCCPLPPTTTPAPLRGPIASLAECGLRAPRRNRIVGGTEASPGAWPWLAALGYRNPQVAGVAVAGPSIMLIVALVPG